MERRTLSKHCLPAFLEALGERRRVVAPRRLPTGDIVFAEYAGGGDVPLDYVNSLLPPKDLFFPRREVLFTIEGSRRPVLSAPPTEKPLAVFGIRSCDVTGLTFLRKFFGERGFVDDSVIRRIDDALILSLACTTPGPDCFCVCCEGGPFLTSGFDLQMVDIGDDALLVEVGSARGQALVDEHGALFRPVDEALVAAKRRAVEHVDATFERRSYIAAGIKRISLGRVPPETWERLAADCQGCGGCCHVCPTCSCFTVDDVPTGDQTWQRERTWDSCLYSGFTREASGHNPREPRAERVKRRFFHKMSFQYIERMGRHGCVGCGRCVTTCMGCLDISTLLERITQDAAE